MTVPVMIVNMGTRDNDIVVVKSSKDSIGIPLGRGHAHIESRTHDNDDPIYIKVSKPDHKGKHVNQPDFVIMDIADNKILGTSSDIHAIGARKSK